mgnify:CR=1 FL=1|jgi:hypothetical protein
MSEVVQVPLIVQEVDGSCIVHFPAGHGVATLDLDSARDAVSQYLGIEADKPKRKIGFNLSV